MKTLLIVLILIIPLVASAGWEMGFKNSDGSQDTYNTKDDSWEMEFKNPDGSVDKYDMKKHDSDSND